MYQRAFPKCPVQGSLEPVPCQRGNFTGSIPQKCSACQYFHGGLCARGVQLTDEMLHLDHGPCSRPGNTDPETINLPNVWPYEQIQVPWKCALCPKMMADGAGGVICTDDLETWGAFPREVDWGKFQPDHPVVGVKGYKIDRDTVLLEARGDRNRAVRAFKAANPKVSMKEAQQVMATVRNKLMMASGQGDPGGPYW